METNDLNSLSPIYIVHGITGYEEREKLLRAEFAKYETEYEFVTESQSINENEALIDKYFVNDIKDKLSKGAIYCTLVHFLIYERFINSKKKYALILENDACFLGDFKKGISQIINEANRVDEGFIISLENSTLRFPPWRKTKSNKFLYEANRGRCAGGYMIDQRAAMAMLIQLKNQKCDLVIDWWHNQMLDKKLLKMYWAHPPIVEQGSFNGKLSSSISSRSNGYLRQIKWGIQKAYKMYIVRLFQ